jgi:hypothetical protein
MPQNTPVYFPSTGWYWMPYYRTSSQSLVSVLASISGSYSIVKSISGDVYWPPYMNTLTDLSAGMGYLIYITQPDTLIYSANTASASPIGKVRPAMPKLTAPAWNTGKTLNVVFLLDQEWNNSEIGIYNSNNELISSAVVIDSKAGFTVFGDDATTQEIESAQEGETLTARLVSDDGRYRIINLTDIKNVLTNETADQLIYKTDAVIVAKANPSDFVSVEEDAINSEMSISSAPNPVSDKAVINITLASAGEYSVEIFTLNGERIGEIARGVSQSRALRLGFDSFDFPSGVYTVIVKNGARIATSKLIIVK